MFSWSERFSLWSLSGLVKWMFLKCLKGWRRWSSKGSSILRCRIVIFQKWVQYWPNSRGHLQIGQVSSKGTPGDTIRDPGSSSGWLTICNVWTESVTCKVYWLVPAWWIKKSQMVSATCWIDNSLESMNSMSSSLSTMGSMFPVMIVENISAHKCSTRINPGINHISWHMTKWGIVISSDVLLVK